MLQIYNTLTRSKQVFQPMEPGKLGIYVCGITVYDYCHLGHARMFVSFDVITRYLRYCGYHVTHVRNITDIDDKIIKRANETSKNFHEVVDFYIKAMDEDTMALGVIPPDIEPKASDHIDEIIALIETLIEKHIAYVTDNGDVYYNVRKFEPYGQLSGKDLDKLYTGVRIEVSEQKKDPLDFALWKASKPGEPSWPSPWGRGRPGWHIECSAMSMKCLGTHFDIHGGGPDLIFPHHENEIAQSEAATGDTFVNVWMHIGSLQVKEEKMSKSLGNFFTIKEVLKQYPAEVVRYFLLASHYRSPLNYTEQSLPTARAALERFYMTLRGLKKAEPERIEHYERDFNAAMDDDFNTPEALAVLFEMSHEINKLRESDLDHASQLGAGLRRLGGVLGILQTDPVQFLQGSKTDEILQEKIESLILARTHARGAKQWALADKIRDQLREMGIELEDSGEATTWRRDD